MFVSITGIEALDLQIADSSMRADELIRRMEEAAAAGLDDVDYSCEGLTPFDERRVDRVYEELFSGH